MENIEQLKDYLKSYQSLKASAKTIQSLHQLFEDEFEKCGKQLHYLHKTLSSSNFSDMMIHTLHLLVEEKWLLCLDILSNINRLDQELEKNVLIQKYISGYTWEQICENLNYSLRQIYNIHNRALNSLHNIMQKS